MKRESISEFQRRLIQKMGESDAGVDYGVIVECGDRHLCFRVQDVGYFSEVPQVTPAPISAGWMLGVAHIQGDVVLVNDLQMYSDGAKTDLDRHARVVIPSGKHGTRSAFLVSRVVTLRQMPERDSSVSCSDEWIAWSGLLNGRRVDVVDMEALLTGEKFINAGASMMAGNKTITKKISP